MARLSYQQRKAMPKSEFVIPGKKGKGNLAGRGGYPIPDISHARNALARVSAHGTSGEKSKVRAAVKRKFPSVKQSISGSPPMTAGELAKGYRSLGKGFTQPMDGKAHATDNRGEGY